MLSINSFKSFQRKLMYIVIWKNGKHFLDNQKGPFYKCTIAVGTKERKVAIQILPCFVLEAITICLLF